MKEQISLWLVAWIGILFLVMGIEGSFGRVLACLLTPSIVHVQGEK